MSNGLSDVMAFGKHKGRMIKDILSEEATYLLWLRDNIAKTKRQAFFDDVVNRKLDGWLVSRASAKQRRDFANWTTNPPDFMVTMAAAENACEVDDPRMYDLPTPTPATREQSAPVAFVTTYGDEWGAW
jgi:hypothetical protein